MGNRPTDWHILDLDRDPVPGDPYEVKELARKLGDFADDVSSALRSVRGLSGNNAVQDWAGLAGDAYREQFGDLPKELTKLEKSYRLASGALETYWPKLETAQADADRALAQGRTARQDLDAARTTQTNANDWVKRAGDKSKEYQADPKPGVEPPSAEEVRTATRNALDASNAQKSANTAVHDAQQRLDAAKELAAQAAHLRDTAASTAEHGLHEASDAGIKNKHWWEKAVDWVADHWDEIVAVCKVIVAVLGIVVLIIGGPLAWIVLAAALVVLADTLVKYAQGKASLWDVAFAALDCIPMFKGLTTLGGLAKMAKGLPALLKSGKALENLANGIRKGGQGLKDLAGSLRRGAKDEVKSGKPMKGRCKGGDPIDMVTGEMLMSQTDVDLPGLLSLTIERHHISSYRSGRLFGPSWTSTLDERLEADGDGVVYGSADGMLQVYPVPQPGTEVFPSQGPRRPLSWDGTPGGEIRISDPATGHTRHYSPLPAADPGGPVVLPLRAISDRNGHRIEFERTATGTPIAVRHSGGYHLAVDTDADRVTGLRLLDSDGGPAGGEPDAGTDAHTGNGTAGTLLRSYGYDDAGNLTSITNASGSALSLTYDQRGRITSWTDRNQYSYRYEYDAATDQVVRGIGPDGSLSATVEYNPELRVNRYTNSLGHCTEYHYDEQFHLLRTVDPHGGCVTTEHDHHGRLLSRTDELGNTSRFALDADGALVRIERPDGTDVSVEYNELHLPVRVTDPGGTEWRYSYDDRGNLLTSTDPLGATSRFSYDEMGRRTAHTDALGHTAHFGSDGAGLPVHATGPLGNTVRLRRDAFGRVVTVSDPVGGTVRQGWTVDGSPAWRTGAHGAREEWTYDAEGNLTRYRNAAGHSTVFEYGAFNLPRLRIDPGGTRYEFTHDTELRLTAVTNPQGLVWSYVFDATGCLTSETDFNGRTLSYTSDAGGRLIERTNGAGQTVRLARDTRGRVTEARTGAGALTTFGYDAAGRLTHAQGPDSLLAYAYDGAGRTITESIDGQAVRSEYDLLGRRVRRTTPTGAVSEWTYDASGLPATLSTAGGELAFQFDQAGRETQRMLGSGAALTQNWDSGHRVTAQAIWAMHTSPAGDGAGPGHEQLQARTYAYRSDGNPTEITDRLRGPRSFELDPEGRVTTVRAETWTESYAYDELGNLTDAAYPAADDETQGRREYSGTLVRRAGRTSYEHDGQGRVVRSLRRTLSGRLCEWRYVWDAEDRLTEVVTPDGTHWRYRYDALGRRIAKLRLDDGGGVAEQTLFAWDGTNLAEQSTVLGGTASAITWDWDPGTYRAATQLHRSWALDDEQTEIDRRFYSIVTDLVGTPTEMVTPDGRIAWRSDTTLWGRPLGTTGQDAWCPLRFPGQYHDAETGFDYNIARYYDADTASYISPDPLGLTPAPNHHAYVDNPTWWSDPLGLNGDPAEPRRVYDDSEYDKHGSGSSSSSKGEIGRAPADGQAALDRSIPRDPGNPASIRRIGVDHVNNEIVVIDRTREVLDKEGNVLYELYHGHVQASYPSPAVQQSHLTRLKKAGMIDNVKKQRVLPPPPCE